MSKACKECKGKGRWAEEVGTIDEAEIVWNECNYCKGTGVEQDPEAGDDYDIGGDSYADID